MTENNDFSLRVKQNTLPDIENLQERSRMNNKHKVPRFTFGQRVNVSILGREAVINKTPFWNGWTWMYSFENEDACCGERYLRLSDNQPLLANKESDRE